MLEKLTDLNGEWLKQTLDKMMICTLAYQCKSGDTQKTFFMAYEIMRITSSSLSYGFFEISFNFWLVFISPSSIEFLIAANEKSAFS